jgi:addiction module HigA family antidote
MMMAKNEFAPVTPGEMLKEEFLLEYGLSQSRLAKAVGISPNRLTEIIQNRRRITANTALRLGLYFGNSPEYLDESTEPLRSENGSAKPDASRCQTYQGETRCIGLDNNPSGAVECISRIASRSRCTMNQVVL